MKPATHSAERAIGAARAAASLVSARKAPEWKAESTTNIRNKAIHAGEYPTADEAERLCIELASTIRDFEAALGAQPSANQSPFHQAVRLEEERVFREQNPGINPSFSAGPEIFDFAQTTTPRPTVEGRIAEYRKNAPLVDD
jgi:hypothetical protein